MVRTTRSQSTIYHTTRESAPQPLFRLFSPCLPLVTVSCRIRCESNRAQQHSQEQFPMTRRRRGVANSGWMEVHHSDRWARTCTAHFREFLGVCRNRCEHVEASRTSPGLPRVYWQRPSQSSSCSFTTPHQPWRTVAATWTRMQEVSEPPRDRPQAVDIACHHQRESCTKGPTHTTALSESISSRETLV